MSTVTTIFLSPTEPCDETGSAREGWQPSWKQMDTLRTDPNPTGLGASGKGHMAREGPGVRNNYSTTSAYPGSTLRYEPNTVGF